MPCGSLWLGSLVSKRDADGTGGLEQLAIGIYLAEPADSGGDWDGADFVILITHHVTKFAGSDQIHGFDAEASSQDTVKRSRRASPLQMSQDAAASVFARPGCNFRSDHFSNAT
jgi:hypothetical protein